MSNQARVLVQIGERRHPVIVKNVGDRLILEIRKVFSDVISEDDFFLHKKWGNEFVDVVPGQAKSNRSIIHAVLKIKVWMCVWWSVCVGGWWSACVLQYV